MQKLVAKYGLAAHLAILAVAPLFLFPFCTGSTIAWALVWVSLPAVLWMVLEPSIRAGERLHEARHRVLWEIFRDPLFWVSLVLVAFTGFRALNTGIALNYDAEASVWRLSEPLFPILPGVAGDSGDLPFAMTLACAVILQGCRHSLGRSARMAFLLLASSLSGSAALVTLAALHGGATGALALLPSADGLVCSSVGLAFGLHLIGGLVALVTIAEQRWIAAAPMLLLAIGGNGAGLFAFALPHVSVPLLWGAVAVLAYVLFFSQRTYSTSDVLKLAVVGVVALVIDGLLMAALLPPKVLTERLAVLAESGLFPERFWKIRGILSGVAFKSWFSQIWIGTGIASFPFDFRFAAQEADWAILPSGATMLANGWWLLLVERGLVGVVCFALPFAFLLVTYVRRLIGGVRGLGLPHPACLIAPVAFLLFVAAGFVDCSPLRGEALMAVCAFLAVSAASFSKMGGGLNG